MPAWDHLSITDPHLVYIILGGFTSLFMLCSSVIKERMYIGEATVATLCGIIFGPHAANLIDPISWGSVDIVTLEFSRIVLVVQCFAVGVELPKFYMEKHWKSVVYLLLPVMTFGWLIVSLFIWWMIPALSWLDSLVVAACVTATDPVLASSVVGKGKFAKRVPKHLRDLLSAESGCNDGMAFPFVYLSIYLILEHLDARQVTFHWFCYTILYECIFGAIFGFVVGYIARHGIKYAEEHEYIDRESFLVFYFVIALFCAGAGSLLGMDDLLVGFAAGVGFSNDGWFGEKTEESHVSNVIDLLLNLAYFVYFGTIIPWAQFNDGFGGLTAWRLVVIAIFVLLFRRIPVMMALKPFIPDIKNWREALFAGHFGPIGVGAIFVALLARAELQHHDTIPLAQMPEPGSPHYDLIVLIWPIVTFLVISSIIVHGSSIAVFTLGKRINTLTLTMSYTAAPEDGPSWMNRLPRISSQSRSQAKTMSDVSGDDYQDPQFPSNTLALPSGFLRRQREEDNSRAGSRASSLVSRRRKHKKWDDGVGPGGPVSQSAIFPARQPSNLTLGADRDPTSPTRETTDSTLLSDELNEKEKEPESQPPLEHQHQRQDSLANPPRITVYQEGDQMVFENKDGDVLDIQPSNHQEDPSSIPELTATRSRSKAEGWSLGGIRQRMNDYYTTELEKRKERDVASRRHEPARAYQFGNQVIVEDKDGEVVKTYELPTQRPEGGESSAFGNSLKYIGLGGRGRGAEKSPEAAAEEGEASGAADADPARKPLTKRWTGLGGGSEQRTRKNSAGQEGTPDERTIRFTIGGVGQRMTEKDFIREVQKLDASTRKEVLEQSTASKEVKARAQQSTPARKPSPVVLEPEASTSNSSMEKEKEPVRGRAGSRAEPPLPKESEDGETAVERRRRLAVLSDQVEESGETPAERRRREAALGMGEPSAGAESDSDDEGGERVPAARRGIRFAEPTRGPK
ncbi:sodium/hydrogen antiporter [Stachybotrys elegans]|uniref:Sodium/hydrogen antiporter n=1 Tax=Stachybotrys elegans TaxID=80388 RepID=A0A8K0WM00_9HYPO|nr:sodium/hydrogen antiporter [Stachybotrys elegans]